MIGIDKGPLDVQAKRGRATAHWLLAVLFKPLDDQLPR